jgi:hypothetical protein
LGRKLVSIFNLSRWIFLFQIFLYFVSNDWLWLLVIIFTIYAVISMWMILLYLRCEYWKTLPWIIKTFESKLLIFLNY